MNKRARRCAARSSTRRKQNNGIKNETQSRAERAIAAKPLGDSPVFSVRQIMRFNAFLYAVGICISAAFACLLPLYRRYTAQVRKRMLLPTHAVSAK